MKPLRTDTPLKIEGTMEPGIYFGMPDEDYHAAKALSSTGVKHMRISPAEFWDQTPWLNTEAEIDPADNDKPHFHEGKGWHARLNEGREVFLERFAPMIDPGEYPDALTTMDQMKAALEASGLPKSAKTKAELAERIRMAGLPVQIWDDVVVAYAAQHEGKTLINRKVFDRIELDAAVIERHPQLSKAFKGGAPEVSIFWYDDETGVPKKCRIDYLKPAAMIEVKSFINERQLPLRRAVALTFANRAYHIQAAWYWDGLLHALEMAREGRVFGDHDPGFIKRFMSLPWDAEQRQILYVFLKKGGRVPVVYPRIFSRQNVFDAGRQEGDRATAEFLRHYEEYGTDMWLDVREVDTIDDLLEIPSYAIQDY